ncbi:hypothetical protein CGCF415_v001114 [Colletotrichum fructicola]|nr:hypothetical protein CGCF415_v001114 [Colletotrichum fructicola]KAF4941820.1 hypothetical protein CGCF245_v001407 [Colletotrichum fructicola]KAF5504247.1 hypothetical protein CGCF413_v004900 [Colletotrichum fructicola]
MDGLLEKIKALPDLRKLDDTTMLERLTTEWPHSLKEKMVNGAFGTTTRGLDVLLVFVRYLVVILPSGPDIDTGSNPIWELAWKDLQSAEYKDNALVLKQEIINAVSKDSTSFFSLCESQIMRETLWSLKELLLCGNPEYLENGCKDWEKIDPPYAAFLAEMSLVSWDGKSEGLYMAVKQVFCERYRSDGDACRLTMPKPAPMIIRVHLKPSAGSNLKEKDLLRFHGGEGADYKLLAAVRLGTDGAKSGDTIQLYAFNGIDILPTQFNASRSRRPEMLGEEGHEYMLFYCSYRTGIRIKDRFACEKNMYVDIDENMTKERFHAKLEKPAKPSTEEDSSTTRPRTRIKAILDALQGNAATGDTGSEAEEGGPSDEAGPTGPSGFGDHEKGYDGH